MLNTKDKNAIADIMGHAGKAAAYAKEYAALAKRKRKGEGTIARMGMAAQLMTHHGATAERLLNQWEQEK